MDPEETRRRIRAARALGGFDSVEDLAAQVDGMGATTIRKMERGERPTRPRELREIAEACGVPYAFFTVDLAMLDSAPDRVDQLEQQLTEVADKLDKLTLQVLPVLFDYEEEEAARTDEERARNTGQRPNHGQRG